jgi:hypothetical protein
MHFKKFFRKQARLLAFVALIESYNETLVREFYSILSTTITQKGGPCYQSLFIRGVLTAFSPEAIAEAFYLPHNVDIEGLGEEVDLTVVCTTLTDGVVTEWPAKGYLKSSSLTGLYFILYKISCYNWLPTNNLSIVLQDRAFLFFKFWGGLSFNLGNLIFNDVVRHAEIISHNTSLMPHPCLISEYLQACLSYMEVKIDTREFTS